MRLTGILLLAGFLQVGAHGRAQTVTYTARAVPLPQVFAAIEQQTGYVFFYDKAWLEGTRPVTVEMKAEPLRQALEQVLDGQPIGFEIREGNTIVLTKRTAPLIAVPMSINIHGRVTDSLGNPLAGASVTVKGGKKGVQTNADGEFVLMNVGEDVTLMVSSVGYETQEIKLKGRTNIVIRMNADLAAMKDVVVNKGYYSEKQRLSTGNVTIVKGEDIQKQPVSDPILALEGRVPGLYISQTSGMPGASYTITLRGKNSIVNGNDALYIIDGVPFPSQTLTSPYGDNPTGSTSSVPGQTFGAGISPFSNLNPFEIESIEILKDADATAIYGSRGANGVILITTKRGKAGQARFNADVNSGSGSVAHTLKLLNTHQYLAMRREAFKNDGLLPGATDYDINGAWDTTRYTDWKKALIGGTAHFTNVNADYSGGNANNHYQIGGLYSKQTTVFPGNFGDQKSAVHFNADHLSADQKFHGSFTAQYTVDNNLLPESDLTRSATQAPDAPALYDSTGHINFQNGTFFNPLAITLETASSITNELISSMAFEYEIVRGLKVQSTFGYTHGLMNETTQVPASVFYGPPIADRRQNNFAVTDISARLVEPQLNYTREIGKGKFSVLIGSTIQRDIYNSLGQRAAGFSSDALISNAANASTITVAGSNYTDYKHNAVYGRLNYSWDDKYVVNATARRDGSSRFGPGKRFGNFGAVGAGWIFSKEKFIENGLPFLSFGKLRGSWGVTGNDQIADYQYLSAYGPSGNYQNTGGLAPRRIANPFFAWEVVKKLEGGLELGLLKDRITVNADYYVSRSGNQLVGQPLPAQDGFTSIQANLPAVVQNSGEELVVSTVNIKSAGFSWTSSFNISWNRNKLVSFPGLATNTSYQDSYVVGEPISIIKRYVYTGVDPATGIYTVQDVDGSGTLTVADRPFQKYVGQNYFGGFLNSISWKGLQLDMLFQFVKQTGSAYTFGLPGGENNNVPTYALSRWQKPGDRTNVAKFTTSFASAAGVSENSLAASNYYIVDASFIRLKNISLSYTLPHQWQHALRLQVARVYIQAQNLLTFTGYHGNDPETQGYNLPPLRMVTAGCQLAF